MIKSASSFASYSAENMIPFIDLAAQQKRIRPDVDKAIQAVLDHGMYIMGPEVQALEDQLAVFTGTKHAVSTSSGTDALILCLMALGLKPGDGVIVPSFSFAASAEVMPCLGAIPIFAEVNPHSFTLDPARLNDALAAANTAGINVVGIIPVGLFGQPSDMAAINQFADQHHLWVLDDAAQSLGATQHGKQVGEMAKATATSFFPAKPLGCYGDGGALFTDDDGLAEIAKSARVHGMGKNRYDYERIGMTARMDTMQAAVLLEKLKLFPEELQRRQAKADRYNSALKDIVSPQHLAHDATSSWAQYCFLLPAGVDRDMVQEQLKSVGIPSVVYYKMGIHEHAPYARYPVAQGGLPVTADLCQRILSLPFHAWIDDDTQDYITDHFIRIMRDLGQA
jgi:dTDP-4-amino-4,6-dideoxygalactose transaminase